MTMAEAKRVAAMLGVGPGDLLPRVGLAGALYARAHRLRCGVERNSRFGPWRGDGAGQGGWISGRYWARVADGGTLPFTEASFDAASHSDVLVLPSGQIGHAAIDAPSGAPGRAYGVLGNLYSTRAFKR